MVVYVCSLTDASSKRMGSLRKDEAQSRVTEPKAKAKGSGRKPKGRRLRRRGSCCEASRRTEKGIAAGRVPESEGRHGNRPDGRGKKHRGNRRQGNTGRRERKDGRLSSLSRAEADERKRKRGESPEAKAEGKHRRNSCGSEAGKDERKQTESRVRETEVKHGKPGGTEVEKPRSRKAEGRTGEAAVRRDREERKGRSRG